MRTLHSAERSNIGAGDGASGSEPSRCDRTGVTIPECGCQACGQRQIAHYAPWIAAKAAQGAAGS